MEGKEFSIEYQLFMCVFPNPVLSIACLGRQGREIKFTALGGKASTGSYLRKVDKETFLIPLILHNASSRFCPLLEFTDLHMVIWEEWDGVG